VVVPVNGFLALAAADLGRGILACKREESPFPEDGWIATSETLCSERRLGNLEVAGKPDGLDRE
jgi:hypothetical protein